MSASMTPEVRAHRLLRAYPPAWRDRYGDEFHELLVADIAGHPRSWRRTADVVRGGVVARLSQFGLCGVALAPADQARAGFAWLGCCAAAFVVFGAAMWSQLTIGWQWSAPNTLATTVAVVVTSLAMFALLGLAIAAAVPVLFIVASRLVRRSTDRLMAPTAIAVLTTVFLFVGGRHFGNGWPGTGGHHGIHQGLVPGGMAAFSWASTLSVSAYWAHPAALGRFPASELAWMAVSPLALVCLVAGVARIVRRLELPAAVLRFEARLATAACTVMVVFLTACCLWVVDGGPGPRNLFHAGAIDVVGIVVMGLGIAAAHLAVRRARLGTAQLVRR